MSAKKSLYELGEMPEPGHVPDRMVAQVIRPERFGEPTQAFDVEVVDTPKELGPDEVLVYVMAAGVNYNNVWAGLGTPIDVTRNRPKDPWFPDASGFHIGGSDASGIVWAVGSEVSHLAPGDRVVIHCGQWRRDDPVVQSGRDPMYAPSFRIWGYETSWGSFAQFTRVQAHQCVPKPKQLSWEAAAAYMLVGATAYRMLEGWAPNTIQPGDPVLVWGARAVSARWRSRSSGSGRGSRSPSSRATTRSRSARSSARSAASIARLRPLGDASPLEGR